LGIDFHVLIEIFSKMNGAQSDGIQLMFSTHPRAAPRATLPDVSKNALQQPSVVVVLEDHAD
jgi:hypothetical protein